MKKLAFLGIFAASALMADEPVKKEIPLATESVRSMTGYGSLGVFVNPEPLPVFGIGLRNQKNRFGFDGSLQVCSIGKRTSVRENFDFLYFPKPNLASQFYAGAGIGVTEFFARHYAILTLSPQLVFGKEYTNETKDRRFFQAQINFPFFGRSFKVDYYPLVVLSYGICL